MLPAVLNPCISGLRLLKLARKRSRRWSEGDLTGTSERRDSRNRPPPSPPGQYHADQVALPQAVPTGGLHLDRCLDR
jgi:hypothetical protein